MIEILIAWKEIACQGVVSGLSWAKVSHIFFRMTDVFKAVSSTYFTESTCERKFISQTLVSSGPTNISRVDSRHSACTLNRVSVEFIYEDFISRTANCKPQRSYLRDAHAVTNFQLQNTIYHFREKFHTDDIFPSRHKLLNNLHHELLQNQPFASSHALIT